MEEETLQANRKLQLYYFGVSFYDFIDFFLYKYSTLLNVEEH